MTNSVVQYACEYLVVGGGVGGVCCVEELCQNQKESVILVSASTILKGVANVVPLTSLLEEFKVEEQDLQDLKYPNLTVLHSIARDLDTKEKVVTLQSGATIRYNKLCIATGCAPRVLTNSPNEITVRDTDTVMQLKKRLHGCKRVIVVGNGGIALELIQALRDMHVVWLTKHEHIGDAFFDLDAAAFLLAQLQITQSRGPGHIDLQPNAKQLNNDQNTVDSNKTNQKLDGGLKGTPTQPGVQSRPDQQESPADVAQPQIGPESDQQYMCTDQQWAHDEQHVRTVRGYTPMSHSAAHGWTQQLGERGAGGTVRVIPNATITSVIDHEHIGRGPPVQRYVETKAVQQSDVITTPSADDGAENAGEEDHQWCVTATLSNGDVIHADLIITGIGADPARALSWVPDSVKRASDGGIQVNKYMQSNVAGVYAAGDSCTIDWAGQPGLSPHFFQMRLWTQARLFGRYAAGCMSARDVDDVGLLFNFEVFTHVTQFFGFNVVLLGQYNGQLLKGRGDDVVMYTRERRGEHGEFVRVVVYKGRVIGAVLIGDTDLEEAMENLITSEIDVGQFGAHLLDPDLDIDHIFD